jgi:hypothetical protein
LVCVDTCHTALRTLSFSWAVHGLHQDIWITDPLRTVKKKPAIPKSGIWHSVAVRLTADYAAGFTLEACIHFGSISDVPMAAKAREKPQFATPEFPEWQPVKCHGRFKLIQAIKVL